MHYDKRFTNWQRKKFPFDFEDESRPEVKSSLVCLGLELREGNFGFARFVINLRGRLARNARWQS
jgi:hypothetical protein